ncbi:PLP-dependent aminotransferase family protein [Nocardia puris]|uniref:aminotransferase-like domain-containing protein n=1 Tax=Nocardia puris TaxID=208602 RepID=UPI00189319A3|nr:PLP-dependent aminotransferase family protein [Nocardia puris]MBF6210625.1 PLP-dependent aminotransferase family protein [Nocardia puris]MBF6369351.1 PLP-dependent aminotransferase family protein [Nocardia puris]MBF6457886.1 PLP-dependent aminotransferase family protein [Nocardia puris]
MEPMELADRLGRWSADRGPLYLLLARRLRTLIDDGELRAGTLLPPDRALAKALAVGRSTVVAAYDLLVTESRVVRRQGSGTRVAGPEALPARESTHSPAFLQLLEPDAEVIALACAAPTAPPPELTRAYRRILPELTAVDGDIGYHPTGYLPLRTAIADRYRARGVPTDPEQILVTGGGQQALSLLARVLLRPGDRVLVEAPTYPGALEAFREAGAVPRTAPVGLGKVDAAALAYVVATCQNPTGAVLSAPARRFLVESARKSGVALIDDEVLADLTFPGTEPPPPPLAHYDPSVISVGSLSKIVWGGLRVGWVRAPVALISRLARARAVHDLGGNIPAQLAAARLLDDLDGLRGLITQQRKETHDVLVNELATRLPDWEIPAVSGGQTLWIRLPYGDGTSFAQRALRHGVAILPGAGLDASGGSIDRIRISFVADPAELREAARRLARAWRGYRPPERPAPAAPPLAV